MTRLVFTESTHAPLRKRYMPSGEFEAPPGDRNEYGVHVDPETGAEYRVTQHGEKHTYNKDYKVGPSYPETVFVYGAEADESLSHEELEAVLRDHDLWDEKALNRVMLPKGLEAGEATWWSGFQYRPPERSPYFLNFGERMERVFGEENVYDPRGSVVEVWIPDGGGEGE